MMKFMIIDKEEFKKIQDSFDYSNFYQTTSWADVKEKTAWDSHYVCVKDDNNKLLAISLLLSRTIILNKKMFYSPRGMLLDYNNLDLLTFFTTEIKKYINNNNGFMLKIDPMINYNNRDKNGNIVDSFSNDEIINNLKKLGYIHKGFSKGYTEEAQYRWSYYLDITDKLKIDLFNNMDQRCRRCIRKYEKYPLITKEVTDDNIIDFKNIMEHTAIRQKHYDRSLEYYQNLNICFKDRIKMIIIYLDRNKYIQNFSDDKLYDKIIKEDKSMIPISAGVFIKDKHKMNYVYGGTYDYYMPFMAQYKLQIDMIYYSIKEKLNIYDFGGITGNFDTDGVYEFKRGFGGYVVEYIGEFDLITNKLFYYLYNFMYKLYRNLKKIKGHLRKKL